MSASNPALLTRLSRARSRAAKRGFTLVEMIIVILIIMILAVVLIIAILAAMQKGKAGDTTRLMDALNTAIDKYQKEKGSFPVSGFSQVRENKVPDCYIGNMKLYQILVGDPSKNYLDINLESYIKYVDSNGKVQPTGEDDRKVFVDGWGNPLVYFEWASLKSAGSTDPFAENASRPKVASWAENTTKWDLYSAGRDGEWGTEDDLRFGEGDGRKSPVTGAKAQD